MKFFLKFFLVSFFVASDAHAGADLGINWEMIEGGAGATAVPVIGPHGLILLCALLTLIALRAVNLKAHINMMLIAGIVGSGVGSSLYIADASSVISIDLVAGEGGLGCTDSSDYQDDSIVTLKNSCPRAIRVTYSVYGGSICDTVDQLGCGLGVECVDDGSLLQPGVQKDALTCD